MAKSYRTPFLICLLVALVVVVAGIEWTASNDQPVLPPSKKTGAKAILVDERPFDTAQRFARYVGSKEEDEYSREAIGLADRELDLAFTTALRQAQENPGQASHPETNELRQRIRDLETQARDEELQIKQLTAALNARSSDAQQEKLELTQAELALHQEELDDAKEDLSRSGDDTEARIQRMLAQHEASEHTAQGTAAAQPSSPFQVPSTLIGQIGLWRNLGKRLFYLGRARQLALDYSQQLIGEHNQLQAQLKQAAAQQVADSNISHSAKLAALKQQAEDRQSLAEYGKRIEAQTKLARVYGDWAALVTTQRQAAAHAGLVSILWILLIVVALGSLDWSIDRFLLEKTGDRRHRGAMRMVVRFILQGVGLIGVLFVLFGRPSQLSTVLGLAGAGLTVALKDFIVGFFGWFVLMGKNGIRVGDWVEINGVGGEVVEIGLLRTVLLETGNWADSGHPTGRKVTFVNSYAIEGHYFNFSTSGQWLWDTLEILLPPGEAPYVLAESVLKLVMKETEANAREAEQEWQHATRDFGVQSFSATPSINLRPSLTGINLIVRYITRANQRYEVRTRLYEGVVGLLHQVAEKPVEAGRS